MKFSEQWLRSWIDPEISTEELTNRLSLAGLEVAGFRPLSSRVLKGVVVGKITATEPHPEAGRLSITTVDVGDESLQIVTNLQGLVVGQLMAVAKPGAEIDDLKVEPKTLRGVTSYGMFAGCDTLGLESDTELPVFPSSVCLGEEVLGALNAIDQLIEIELTANRGDCLSIEGLAREVAAITNTAYEAPFKESELSHFEKIDDTIQVDADDVCRRYHGATMVGINADAKTPSWMKDCLSRSDIQTIHPVVDILNYVMLELGQPMHAFDLDKLEGGIVVRYANDQESLLLLNKEKVDLKSNTLVIADAKKPLAIAGVMGGLDSGVGVATREILIECAHFTPEGMMGKAREYGLHTDASHRYERGVDPNLVPRALARATELLTRITGATLQGVGRYDAENDFPKLALSLRLSQLTKWLGISFDLATVCDTLEYLGFEPRGREGMIEVSVPRFRFDVTSEVDLIEEIARIYGYENFPSTLDAIRPDIRANQQSISEENRQLKSKLAAQGLKEVITYSFQEETFLKDLGFEEALRLSNPITHEMDAMRPSILPGLIKTYKHWQSHGELSAKLFEIGTVFLNQGQDEVSKIAVLLAGGKTERSWHPNEQTAGKFDFYDAKGLLDGLSLEPLTYQPVEHHLLHPGRSATIFYAGMPVGFVGVLHPQWVKKLKLKETPVLFECDREPFIEAKRARYAAYSKFPSVKRDLAFWLDQEISFQELSNTLKKLSLEHLKGYTVFDVFEDKVNYPNKKSLAIALIFQSDTYTLKDEVVDKEIETIIDVLRKNHCVSLRE